MKQPNHIAHDIHPRILTQSFGERLDEVARQRNLKVLVRNLGGAGILRLLGEEPWTEYTRITDEIEEKAEVDLKSDIPELLRVRVKFGSQATRAAFEDVFDHAMAGIHGVGNMPVAKRDGSRGLELQNFGYPDLSTMGRTGSGLLLHEHGDALGPNYPLVGDTIQNIMANNNALYLPDELNKRIVEQDNRLTPLLDGAPSLLTSGSLALIGHPMREVLRRNGLPINMQRPRNNRPFIETGTIFTSTGGNMPRSGSTLAGDILGQWAARIQEATGPFRVRNADTRSPAKVVEGLGDAVTGGLLLKLAGAAMEAGWFTTMAVPPALIQHLQRPAVRARRLSRIPEEAWRRY